MVIENQRDQKKTEMIEENKEKGSPNSLEDRPLTGNGSYAFNQGAIEKPLTGKGSYSFEGESATAWSKPLNEINGGRRNIEEKPLTGKGQYTFEEDMLEASKGPGTKSIVLHPKDKGQGSGTGFEIGGKRIEESQDENELPGFPKEPLAKKAPKGLIGAKKGPRLNTKKASQSEIIEEPNRTEEMGKGEAQEGFINEKMSGIKCKDDVPITGKGAYCIIEETPVGSNSDQQPLDEYGASEETRPVESGPLASRVKSKAFQTRMAAFEELKNIFENADPSDDIFREFGHEMHKFIGDAMPAPQEKACGALKAFLEKSKGKDTGLNFGLCTKAIIEKCLSGGKPNVIGVANECLVLLFEASADKQTIFESIIYAISHKNLKVTVAGLSSVLTLLTNFGPQKLDYLKPFYSHVEKAAGNTNNLVRNEAMNFYKEGYKWIGEAMKNYMSNLKKTQVDDLEKHFKENPRVPMVPLRGGPAIGTGAKASGSAEGASGPVAMMEDIDPYDMANPVDIFKQFNDSWSEKTLAIPKWKEKKDALDEFLKAASAPKIIGNCGHMTGMVKKLFMDNNVSVQVCGIKILGALAKSMRKGFVQAARLNVEPVLAKIKDKKPQVSEEAMNTLESFFYCLTLEDLLEDMKALLADKNPSMRVGLMRLGETYFTKGIGKGPNNKNKIKSGLKGFVPIAKKLLEDSNPEVKESAVSALKSIYEKFEEEVGVMLEDVNPQKLSRIKDSSKLEKNTVELEQKPQMKSANENLNQGGGAKIGKGGSSAKEDLKLGKKVPDAVQKNSGVLKGAESNETMKMVPGMSTEEAEGLLLASGLPENAILQIYSTEWKEKVAGVSAMRALFAQDPSNYQKLIEAVLACLKKSMKSWKESTLMLNKEVFSLVNDLVENPEANLTRGSWSLACSLVVEKSIDSKFFEHCYSIAKHFCKSLPAKFIIAGIIKEAAESGPKTLSEISKMLIKLQEDVGPKNFPVFEAVGFAKIVIMNQNASAKLTGFSLLKELFKYSGEPVRTILGELGAALQKSVDSELSSVQVANDIPKPKLVFKGEANEVVLKMEKLGGVIDTIPRSDISSEANKLLKLINDKKDWNTRKTAVDKLDHLIASAKGRVLPNGLGDLVTSIKARLTDSNKSVARSYIGFVGRLAEALGKDFRLFGKSLLLPLVMTLSDKQSILKSETMSSVDKISSVIGLDDVFAVMLPSLATENPDLRVDVVSWMLRNPEGFKKADIKGNIQSILLVAQDKTKEVKALVDPLIEKCIGAIGPKPFRLALKDMKLAVAQLIRPIIDKHAPPGQDNPPSETRGRLQKNKSTSNISAGESESDDMPPSPSFQNQRSHTPSGLPVEFGDNQTGEYYSNPNENYPRVNPICFNPRSQSNFEAIPRGANQPRGSWQSQTGMIEEKPRNQTNFPSFKSNQVIYPSGNRIKRNMVFSNWNLEELSDEHIELLKELIMQCFHPKIAALMFSYESKKIIQASEALKATMNTEWSNAIEVVDLIVKWVFFRLVQENSVSINCEVLSLAFELIEKVRRDQMTGSLPFNLAPIINDSDSSILISCIFLKMDSRNDSERNRASNCLKSLSLFSHPELIYQCTVRSLEKEKDEKVTQGYLDLLLGLLQNERSFHGISLSDIGVILQFIWVNAPTIQQLALDSLRVYYQVLGQKLVDVLMKFPIQNEHKEALLKAISGHQSNPVMSHQQMSSLSPIGMNPSGVSRTQPNGNQLAGGITSSPLGVSPSDGLSPIENEQIVIRKDPISENSKKNSPEPKEITQGKNKAEEALKLSIYRLESGNPAMVFDSLMRIHDLLTEIEQKDSKEAKDLLLSAANDLVTAYTNAMNVLFQRSRNEFNPNFLQYYLNVLHRLCSWKVLFDFVHQNQLRNLLGELIRHLILESEFKDEVYGGANKSDLETHVKLLNSAILRVLENAKSQETFLSLFELLISTRRKASYSKMMGLIVKCLLKLTKAMEFFIESMKPGQILLKTHEFLSEFISEQAIQPEDIGVKALKAIISELVKLTGNDIWTAYAVIEQDGRPDHYLKRWIEMSLKPNEMSQASFRSQTEREFQPPLGLQQQRDKKLEQKSPDPDEVLRLIEIFKSTDPSNRLVLDQVARRLSEVAQRHPSNNLNSSQS